MCCGCWREAGEPSIDNEGVRNAIELVKRVYEFNCAGGNLHVLLDDFNYEDHWFEDDNYSKSIDQNLHGHTPEQRQVERQCLAAMAALSEAERASVLGLHDGCWRLGEDS